MLPIRIHTDTRFLHHDTGTHPENELRLRAIDAQLRNSPIAGRFHFATPDPATREDILRAHTERHFARISAVAGRRGRIDPDTVHCEHTAEIALLAAGAAIDATRSVVKGEASRTMALVRPPGHHATRDRAMGFCFYNNVAVAVRWLQSVEPGTRAAIIDFDVHHGNGTQDIFYEDPDVFFFSIHQDNLFPSSSGGASEQGAGAGIGTTLNMPVPNRCARGKWMEHYAQGIEKVFAFKPEMIFFSAGFDAHKDDPLGGLSLETRDFYSLTRLVAERSNTHGVRGIVSVLEGGYNVTALAESVEQHLTALVEP
ncbi:histone deacetylase [Candidatus Sumerlaeota bacterium]|nr:histone deacetylase [Candidatus Sumerlaeota bacterium]